MSKNNKSKRPVHRPKHPAKRKKVGWVHPQVGTHLYVHPHLNPKHPKPKEPGERRGTGKPFIRIEVLNAITYRLSEHGRAITHHEICGQTITGAKAEAFIRDWLGLNPDNYCRVIKTSHTFTQDIPKLTVEPLNKTVSVL